MTFSAQKILDQWFRSLRVQPLGWGIGFGLVLLVAGVWLGSPLYQRFAVLRQAEVAAKDLALAQQRLDQVKLDVAAWEAVGAEHQQQLDLMLPTTPDLPDLIVELETLARQNGFVLGGMAVTDPTGESGGRDMLGPALPRGVHRLHVSLGLEQGSYANLKVFLAAAASAWRTVQVDTLGFGSNSTSYNLELSSFYYRP